MNLSQERAVGRCGPIVKEVSFLILLGENMLFPLFLFLILKTVKNLKKLEKSSKFQSFLQPSGNVSLLLKRSEKRIDSF